MKFNRFILRHLEHDLPTQRWKCSIEFPPFLCLHEFNFSYIFINLFNIFSNDKAYCYQGTTGLFNVNVLQY